MSDSVDLVNGLRSTLGKMEVVLGSIVEAIAWTDSEGKVQWTNTTFDHLIGRPRLQSLGMQLINLLPLQQQGQDLLSNEHPVTLALQKRLKGAGYYKFQQNDCGLMLEISWDCVQLKDDISAVLVIRDITERHQSEQELQQYREHLEALVAERTTALADTNQRLQQEIRDRWQAEQELRNSETALRTLYTITADPELTFDQRLQALLALGCQHFGLEMATLGQVEGDRFEVIAVQLPSHPILQLKRGDILDLRQTYCHTTLGAREPVAFEHARASEWCTHPAYQAYTIEGYIGTPVSVIGDMYGVLSFFSLNPRQKEFTSGEKEFLQLMAQWIGTEIERQRSQVILQASEERFRQLAETIQEIFWLGALEEEYQIIYVSPSYERIWGYRCEDLYQNPNEWLNAIHPSDYDRVYTAAKQMWKNGLDIEYRIVRPDGSIRWIHDRGFPIRNQQGTVYRIAGIAADITERKQAEEALRKSEARQRALLEAIPDVMLRISRDGVYLDCKPCKTAKLLLPTGELIGKHIDEVMPAPIAQQLLHHIEQALKTNQTEIFEHRLEIDGEPRDEEQRVVVSGKNEVLVIVRDITERKRAEAEIQRQNLRSRLLAEVSLKIRQSLRLEDILQATVTEVRDLLQADRALILRFSPVDGSTNVFTKVVTSSTPDLLGWGITDDCFDSSYFQKYRQGRIYTISDIDKADVTPCLVELLKQIDVRAKLVVPILLQQTLWGLLVIHQCHQPRQWTDFEVELLQQLADQVAIALTQAHLVEALQQSEEKFRNLVEQTNDWVWETNANAILTYANPRVKQVLGYEPEEVMGKSLLDFMQEDASKRFSIILNHQITSQKSFTHFEVTLLHRNHCSVTLETSSSPVYDTEGNLQGYRGIARDITNRKETERAIRQALAKEKELNELKSRFISMASHEFRTPLSVILTCSELLETYGSKWTETEKLEPLQMIQTSVQDMTQLLEDVLTLSRAEAGKLQSTPVALDLPEFCDYLVQQMELSTNRKCPIHFVSHCSDSEIHLDAKLLRQILINLLSNAIKYSAADSIIQFELNCEPGKVIFQIQDNGIGIPIEDQSHLFESFHRANNVGTISGTGLGLAIVKRCIDVLQGQIFVDSQVGVGTTFRVVLPLNRG